MPALMIDVHSHPLFPELKEALGTEAGDMPLPDWSAEQHIETMDRNGIDVCVLSSPGLVDGVEGSNAQSITRMATKNWQSLSSYFLTDSALWPWCRLTKWMRRSRK